MIDASRSGQRISGSTLGYTRACHRSLSQMMDAISNCTSAAANNLDQVIKPNIMNVNTMEVTKWNHTRISCSWCRDVADETLRRIRVVEMMVDFGDNIGADDGDGDGCVSDDNTAAAEKQGKQDGRVNSVFSSLGSQMLDVIVTGGGWPSSNIIRSRSFIRGLLNHLRTRNENPQTVSEVYVTPLVDCGESDMGIHFENLTPKFQVKFLSVVKSGVGGRLGVSRAYTAPTPYL
nr:hypothetical protein [Tanacetum cinerariifolium]